MMINELEPILKEGAVKRWRDFAKALHQVGAEDTECVFTFNWDKNIAQTIYDFAVDTQQDLIVIGSKGKGGLAAFVIGSVALQLVKYDLKIPLLVIKKE